MENKEIRERIGKHIATLRHQRKMSQEMLAEKSGVSLRAIQGIETGKFSARLDTLQQIAEALDCDVTIISRPKDVILENNCNTVNAFV